MTVDGDFIAAARDDVRVLAVDGGGVLVAEATGDVVPLNATGMLVFGCFDGASSMADICRDLADGLDAPYESVFLDTIAIADRLVAQGVVVDARRGSESPGLSTEADGSGRRRLDRFAWASALEVPADDHTIVIRSNDPAMLELLQRAVDGARDVPLDRTLGTGADLSLVIGPARGAIPPVHRLYRGDAVVTRTPSVGRLLRSTLRHCEGFLPVPTGLVQLQARAVSGRNGVVLVGGAFLEVLDLAGEKLAAQGWRVLDGPTYVSEGGLEVVVPPRRLVVSRAGLAAIDEQFPRAPGEAAFTPGSHSVLAVIVVGNIPDEEKLRSPTQWLAALAPIVGDLAHPGSAHALSVVGRVASSSSATWVMGVDDRELIDRLAPLAGQRVKRAR